MNDRFFDISYFPENSNKQEETTVRSFNGMTAIEKLKRLEGENILIVGITEVEMNQNEEENLLFTDNSNIGLQNIEPTSLSFIGNDGKLILKLGTNGDIYVNGRLVENDKEVVDGFRTFLSVDDKPNWRD